MTRGERVVIYVMAAALGVCIGWVIASMLRWL